MGAYVRYIQASGARVVPLIQGESEEILLHKLNHINGVLFPGGDGDYYEKGRFVFETILEFNKQNKFYPLWGTCLGYEYLIAYTTDLGKSSWGIYDYHKVSLPIFFTKNPKKTKMFQGLGDTAFEFSHKNFTYNSHRYGISPDFLESDIQLKEFWDVTSISLMPNGTEFTASIESKNYPIFGTQFHPEKASQLWIDGFNINHSWESLQL